MFFFNPAELLAWVTSLASAVRGDAAPRPGAHEREQALVNSIRLNPPLRRSLEQALHALGDDSDLALVSAWLEGVELTALRTGLLLCADIEGARAMLEVPLGGVAHGAPALSQSRRERELSDFARLPVYQSLRAAMQLTVPNRA